MEPRPTWKYREPGGKSSGDDRDASWQGILSQVRTKEKGESKTIRDKTDVRYEGILHHWDVETLENTKDPTRHPCTNPDRVIRLSATNMEKTEVKRRGREGPFHPWSSRSLGKLPRRGIETRGRRRPRSPSGTGEARKAMASSSGSKPTTKERLKSLEEGLHRLKQLLHNHDDFLQNMDIEAGRRLEMIEADITSTKIGFSEELEHLCKEFKDPKKELEERVNKLEEQMTTIYQGPMDKCGP
jgi:hypothetical protein